MLRDHKGHFLIQRKKQIIDLSRVPESRRAGHFVEKHLAPADRDARRAAKLKIGEDKLAKALQENSLRLDDFRRVAETRLETLPKTPRSCAPTHRGRHQDNHAQNGR